MERNGQPSRPSIGARRRNERGTMLLVVVFVAVSIAGLATILSGRVVSESKQQRSLEEETQAFNSAYAQLQMAMNVVNTSPYSETNDNLVLREAISGANGGTIQGSTDAEDLPPDGVYFTETGEKVPAPIVTDQGDLLRGTHLEKPGGENTGYLATQKEKDGTEKPVDWLDDASDPLYGFVRGTNVRVYRGRDYIERLQRLRGESVTEVDPENVAHRYFVLEAAGRIGNTIRLVSALVRENEPFSSFVFFQNRATLGISGSPRGLIHSNETLAFYFPNGRYLDSVSAVDGFEYLAGAEPDNTQLRDANPEANKIELEAVDFDELKAKADLYVGDPGLDAEIKLESDGDVKIRPHTPPRYELVTKSYTYSQFVGTEDVVVTETQQVQVGEEEVEYTEQVIVDWEEEEYTEMVRVQTGTTTVEWTEEIEVKVDERIEIHYREETVQTGTEEVTKTREEPVFEEQTVTKTRPVKVWEPYNQGDADGGTAIGGGADGELGEWVWIDEEYEVQELVQTGVNVIEYVETEPVYGTIQVPYEVTIDIMETQTVGRSREDPVYEWVEEERERLVPEYETVTKTRMEPVYEWQEVEVTKTKNVYEDVTVYYDEWEYYSPVYFDQEKYTLGQGEQGVVFVDGRITELGGELNGRLTIVGSETVRITDSIQYVDDDGETAMLNGDDYRQPYKRNAEYDGNSVLGVIAKEDVLLTRELPNEAELNGTFMAIEGRVGVDGFWADDETGELTKDSWSNREEMLSYDKQIKEWGYDRWWWWQPRTFIKDSLRRIGGVISNNRILETFVVEGDEGYAKVDAGFKRGRSMFDISLLFNPPPNFVEVPRPVMTAVVPVFLVLNEDI